MASSRFWREIRQFDELMERFRAMDVDATEYACLKGIVLFKTGARFLFEPTSPLPVSGL